jgi:hypothetical protein
MLSALASGSEESANVQNTRKGSAEKKSSE